MLVQIKQVLPNKFTIWTTQILQLTSHDVMVHPFWCSVCIVATIWAFSNFLSAGTKMALEIAHILCLVRTSIIGAMLNFFLSE